MDMPFPPTPPENVTNGQLYAAIQAIAHTQNEQSRRTNEQLGELRNDFEQYKNDHREMVETWTTAKGTMRFIKFLAVIGVPVGAIVAVVAGVFNKGG